MKLILLALLFLTACSDGETPKGAEKSYEAITDSSRLTKDSLDIPDSTTPSVTH